MHINESLPSYILSALIGVMALKIWVTERRKRISRRRRPLPTSTCLQHLTRQVGTRNEALRLPRRAVVSPAQPSSTWTRKATR